MEEVVQFLGMAFVCIIIICIGWSIVEYIFGSVKPKNKLEENIEKLNRKMRQ